MRHQHPQREVGSPRHAQEASQCARVARCNVNAPEMSAPISVRECSVAVQGVGPGCSQTKGPMPVSIGPSRRFRNSPQAKHVPRGQRGLGRGSITVSFGAISILAYREEMPTRKFPSPVRQSKQLCAGRPQILPDFLSYDYDEDISHSVGNLLHRLGRPRIVASQRRRGEGGGKGAILFCSQVQS